MINTDWYKKQKVKRKFDPGWFPSLYPTQVNHGPAKFIKNFNFTKRPRPSTTENGDGRLVGGEIEVKIEGSFQLPCLTQCKSMLLYSFVWSSEAKNPRFGPKGQGTSLPPLPRTALRKGWHPWLVGGDKSEGGDMSQRGDDISLEGGWHTSGRWHFPRGWNILTCALTGDGRGLWATKGLVKPGPWSNTTLRLFLKAAKQDMAQKVRLKVCATNSFIPPRNRTADKSVFVMLHQNPQCFRLYCFTYRKAQPLVVQRFTLCWK